MPIRRTISCDYCGYMQLKRNTECDGCGRMTRRERTKWRANAVYIGGILLVAGVMFAKLSP